jgi:hypothetical protein
MAPSAFLKRRGIVRSAIKADVLFFGLPALLVFATGLAVSGGSSGGQFLDDLSRGRLHFNGVPSVVGLAFVFAGYAIAFVAVGTLRRFYLSTWRSGATIGSSRTASTGTRDTRSI